MVTGCAVTNIDLDTVNGKTVVTGLQITRARRTETITVGERKLVFFQNGSMTDASSADSMTRAPGQVTKDDSGGWALWEKLAKGRPDFGHPAVFSSNIAESFWESFTITLKRPTFFQAMEDFTGNRAGTGGLVTFKDSNWLMSIVLAHQPHFIDQPADIQVCWGYALHPDRVGNFVAEAMVDCTGEEILHELCGHLNFDLDTVASANRIPCRMPYITSMFMPRSVTDRPRPVPKSPKNLAFVSQFVKTPSEVVFTVEYSVRAAQMAVYELLNIERAIPPIEPHDQSIKVMLEAVIKAFKLTCSAWRPIYYLRFAIYLSRRAGVSMPTQTIAQRSSASLNDGFSTAFKADSKAMILEAAVDR